MSNTESSEQEAGALSHLSGGLDVAETGVFAISINVGYCEHTYTIKLKDELSIHKLMKKICKKLKVDMPDSKLRWFREFGNSI